METPFLLMIAGPNGSGKTTLTRRLIEADIDLGEYINPDDIAATLDGSYEQRTRQAQTIAEQLRNQHIERGQSFSFETVMSHPSKLDILIKAKEAGFQVKLFFVGTDDPQTNVERVALRVKNGGHDVPTDKIVSRWTRTMNHLSEAIRSVDEAFVFDNSIVGTVDSGPRLVFRRSTINRRNIPLAEQFPPVPAWVEHYALRPLAIQSTRQTAAKPLRSVISAPFESTAQHTTEFRNKSQAAPKTTAQYSGLQGLSKALINAIDTAAKAFSSDGGLSGLATGFHDLDRITGGLNTSELIILGSRPSIGKTSLAVNIAHNVARAYNGRTENEEIKPKLGGTVGFFSLEMSAEQLATRIISQQTNVSANFIRNGRITEEDFEAIRDAAIELQTIPLYIDDASGLSISQLASRTERLKNNRGLDFLVIDNIDLIRTESGRTSENARDISKITQRLKSLAKDLNVPILALVQLSPQIHNTKANRPSLTDLRARPSIEKDSDLIFLLHREEYFLSQNEPSYGSYEHEAWVNEMSLVHGKAELAVVKQRSGRTGIVPLVFDESTGRFGDTY